MDLARSLQTLVSLVRAFARSLGRTRKQRADAVARARSERGQWRLGVRDCHPLPSVCLSVAGGLLRRKKPSARPSLPPSFLPSLPVLTSRIMIWPVAAARVRLPPPLRSQSR